jgi:hypothetical protein
VNNVDKGLPGRSLEHHAPNKGPESTVDEEDKPKRVKENITDVTHVTQWGFLK